MKNKKGFCVAPFRHSDFLVNGEVWQCCNGGWVEEQYISCMEIGLAMIKLSYSKDLIAKKQEILSRLVTKQEAKVLFVGFNPAILNSPAIEIFVTEIGARAFEWLKEQNPNIQLYSNDDRRLHGRNQYGFWYNHGESN